MQSEAVEAGAVFLVIEAYIWLWRSPILVLIALAIVLWRGLPEGWLGVTPIPWWTVLSIFCAAAIGLGGIANFAAYCAWGLFQQALLNGYFTRRVGPAPAAVLFAIAHLPNPLLTVVTLVGGYASAVVYGRRENLLFLGLAHAAIGSLLYLIVPDAVTHHLRVGPGWYRP